MQAIITKYLPATNTRSSRIKATTECGSLTISYPYALSGEDVHRKAAVALCVKLGWTAGNGYSRSITPDFSNLVGGGTANGHVFVFAPITKPEFCCTACGREELTCSIDPCPAVIADRAA